MNEQMTMTDYPSMTYSDLIGEFKFMRNTENVMASDCWGETMECWFAVAGELFERGCDIPAEWQYRAGLGGGKDPDSYWTEMLETVSDEDLLRFGKLLARYAGWLEKAGKDY